MAESVFKDMLDKLDPKKDKIDSAIENDDGSNPKVDKPKSSSVSSGSKDESSVKTSKSSKVTKSTKASTSKDSAPQDIGSLLMKGFEGLQQSIESLGDKVADKVSQSLTNQFAMEEEQLMEDDSKDDDSHDDEAEIDNPDIELFKTMVESFETEDNVGDNVNKYMAELINTYLGKRMSADLEKQKSDKYLRPKNVSFAEAPRTNKTVFDILRHFTKVTDVNLQSVQKNMLKSVLPIIEILNELPTLGLEKTKQQEIIQKLTDSVAFTGIANVNMVKIRKLNIKKDLPARMKGLCAESGEFSGKSLFGDNLTTRIKEVSDMNKVSMDFKRSGSRGTFRGFRGPGRFIQRGTRYRRGRFNPYNRFSPNKKNIKYQGNKPGPSKQ